MPRSVYSGIRIKRQPARPGKLGGVSEEVLHGAPPATESSLTELEAVMKWKLTVVVYLLIRLLTSISYRNYEGLNAHLHPKNTYLL